VLSPELAKVSHGLPGPAGELLCGLATDLGTTIVTSVAVRGGQGELWNTGLIVTPDGIAATGAKRGLWGAEPDFFTPGAPAEQAVADTPVGRIGVAICYEGGFPEVARNLALAGARIIALPAAFGAARLHAWKLMTRARALENGCYLVAANTVGPSAGLTFCGHSTIVDPHGERQAVLPEGEGRVVARLDPDTVDEARAAIPYLRDLHRVATPGS
jgi:predicted amidohydrolase